MFCFSTDGDDVAACALSNTETKKPNKPQTAADDGLGLDDLPPVPDLSALSLNVKEEDCMQIGTVSSIVDRLGKFSFLPHKPYLSVHTDKCDILPHMWLCKDATDNVNINFTKQLLHTLWSLLLYIFQGAIHTSLQFIIWATVILA